MNIYIYIFSLYARLCFQLHHGRVLTFRRESGEVGSVHVDVEALLIVLQVHSMHELLACQVCFGLGLNCMRGSRPQLPSAGMRCAQETCSLRPNGRARSPMRRACSRKGSLQVWLFDVLL